MKLQSARGKAYRTLVGLAGALGVGVACADTILFPVISHNGANVTTLISVVNRFGEAQSSHLKYIYRYKTTSSLGAECASTTLTRPTLPGDLVSFDPAGILNGGDALFGDANDYGGSFSMGITNPLRAYLLVTNANAAGNRVNVGNVDQLSGEAVSLDIGHGGAWGMRAINDVAREDYSFVNASTSGGGVYAALPSNGSGSRRFTFFPPSEWSTRFFVTPIGENMNTANREATVRLRSDTGVVDRQGTIYEFTPIERDVTCTGAVNLSQLFNSTVWAAVENLGGWSWLNVKDGDAVIYKLEYAIDDPTYGGTVNNGYLFSSYELP